MRSRKTQHLIERFGLRSRLVGSELHRPAHEAKAVEAWLEGRDSQIELHWLPRYAPAYNPDEFLNNDLKQELNNEPMPDRTPELCDTIDKILDRIASMSDRIQGTSSRPKPTLP
jgi:hypothetical protein